MNPSQKRQHRYANFCIFFVILLMISFRTSATEKSRRQNFNKKIIQIGSEKLNVETAETDEQFALGLMFRKQLKEGRGMLFIFRDEQPRTFWMKNTYIPLSIGFFDSKKKLIDIQNMEPAVSDMDSNIKTYTSKGSAQYALEVPQGWYIRKNIKIGATLTIH